MAIKLNSPGLFACIACQKAFNIGLKDHVLEKNWDVHVEYVYREENIVTDLPAK